jgi:hypothetical protein
MLQLFCKRFERERELGICILDSTHFVNEEKESVFLRIRKGKHFPAIKCFFFFDRNSVSLTNFSYVYQTWKKGFQENKFLETNKALI